MNTFDETVEAVALLTSGRKKKRKPEEYGRSVAKKARHRGGVPRVACRHNHDHWCQAARLSDVDVAYINRVLYTTSDKVKQDATLLSYMDIRPVRRRRTPRVQNPAQQRTREVSINYSVLTDTQEKISVCKASFMALFCEYLIALIV